MPSRWGVEYPGGFGEVGPVRHGDLDEAVRPFRLLAGDPPADGVAGHFTAAVWPNREVFTADTGIVGYDRVIEGETGPLPAWLFPAGDGVRWAILVHGRGTHRAQMLRLVPTLHRAGITSLVISYRNDFPTCSDPSGRMHLGHREWRDLEAAAARAWHDGARALVLGGMSMGGALIAAFMRRSALASKVVGCVFDAPALNYGPILRHMARQRRIPGWLVPPVMTAAGWQARIDWAALNHLHGGEPLAIPVLLVHGDRDLVVPVEISDAYAEAAPGAVSYLRVAGAGHVSAWNSAPERYDGALAAFLEANGLSG